jgi:hypothetical protein
MRSTYQLFSKKKLSILHRFKFSQLTVTRYLNSNKIYIEKINKNYHIK